MMLREIFGLHLFTGIGNQRVYTYSYRVVIGIYGRRSLWQRCFTEKADRFVPKRLQKYYKT